jgi:hypothetical protein
MLKKPEISADDLPELSENGTPYAFCPSAPGFLSDLTSA